MFFIGGFNTIIPYILYISLLWAFMIIGLSGKVNILWPHKINYAQQSEITAQAGNYFIYVAHAADKSLKNINENIPYLNCLFPDEGNAGIIISLFNDGPPNHRAMYSPHFRGPPHIVTDLKS